MSDDDFPVAEQIREAVDDAARARLLLACPYAFFTLRSMALKEACRAVGFEAGAAYVEAMFVGSFAVRDQTSGRWTEDVLIACVKAEDALVREVGFALVRRR